MLLLFIVGTCIIIGSIIFFTNTNEKNYPYAAGVFFVGVLFISGAVATLSDNNENIVRQGKIDIPSELIHYEKKKVDTVINLFKQLGFENITTIELNDLVFSLHENEVETIMIDGTQKWITDRCAYPNSRIVITYHSKRK